MKPLRRPIQYFARCPWLLALVLAFLAPAVQATIPLYVNEGNSIYTIPGNPPPQIDARGFFNDSGYTFGVDFNVYNAGGAFYETANTLFYTNAGTMIVSGLPETNSEIIEFSGAGALTFTIQASNSFACGFQFDQQTASQNLWAETFYNPGTIRCGSEVDGNDFTYALEPGGVQQSFFVPNLLGQCLVAATNIIDPGTIEVSYLGTIKLTGRNVDVSQGQLIQDPQLSFTGESDEASLNVRAAVGVNTNVLWNPYEYLDPPYAYSSYVPLPPYDDVFLALTNCLPYATIDEIGTNTIVYRYVFIENDSPDVSALVYFDPINDYSPLGLDFFPGEVHVQWTGQYIDPASGAPVTSYLYLSDDYLYGANTNDYLFFNFNGLPLNFDLTQSPTLLPMLTGPAPEIFYGVTPDAFMTNNYAAFVGSLTTASVSTNISYSNPHGTITNLPGQVWISASNELNLAFTTVTGPNYLNLNCTNQFNGSPGAHIASPYSDISLGVTNGFLTVSNVLMANLPNWSGPISAWSSVWDDYTTTPGMTNEYRVLIVYSDFGARTKPWIQNLYLHGTNTLSVSDHLNVYGSLFSDAKVLVLQTNQAGQGATSLDGEINYVNPATFNANSGSGAQQMPHLLSLTNYGMFKVPNFANFGNAATNFISFINHSLVADAGATIWTGYFDSDGTIDNGNGTFALHAGSAALDNGTLTAGGDVLLAATNHTGSGALWISNQVITAGQKLTLWTSNLRGDCPTNHTIFTVGANSGGGTLDSGFNINVKPAGGNLLGATVTNIAPNNKTIYNIWAGHNFGLSPVGYTNNLAIGHLILDSLTTNQTGPVAYNFSGPDATNPYALYVDLLELKDGARFGDLTNNYNFPWLQLGTNMTIYFAQALINGRSVAEAIDDQSKLGANGGRLRWVYTYAGYYSSTNLYYTNTDGSIITNTVNTALAQSSHIDSNSDGIPNLYDPTPFFEPTELNFSASVTNLPPPSVRVQWTTIPNATNYVYYTTNLLAADWLPLTNFSAWHFGDNALWPNPPVSPQIYLDDPNLGPNAQQANVWLYDKVTRVPHYYKVVVWPALDFVPGP